MRTINSDYLSIIENYVDDYLNAKGVSPTILEIAASTGISKSTVGRYLIYMRENDMLEYDGHRNIRTKNSMKSFSSLYNIPVIGSIACGKPIDANENISEFVKLPISFLGRGDFFIVYADGDSMIDIGINDGDMVVVKKQNFAEPGQVVVALMEDEATLKRYYPEPEKHRIRLHPENKKMKDIIVDDCMIQGIAVKVLKDVI